MALPGPAEATANLVQRVERLERELGQVRKEVATLKDIARGTISDASATAPVLVRTATLTTPRLIPLRTIPQYIEQPRQISSSAPTRWYLSTYK